MHQQPRPLCHEPHAFVTKRSFVETKVANLPSPLVKCSGAFAKSAICGGEVKQIVGVQYDLFGRCRSSGTGLP